MIAALSALVVVVLMEPYAALVHRLLWHGPLWRAHRDHHRPGSALGPNDALSLSHAPLAVALCAVGWLHDGPAGSVLLGAGAGMALFGALYVVFHDGMVHDRLPVRFLLRLRLCRAWRDAHARHHASAAAPFGFFLSPLALRMARGRETPGALAVDVGKDGAACGDRRAAEALASLAHEPPRVKTRAATVKARHGTCALTSSSDSPTGRSTR